MRLLTYNIHGCIGSRARFDPEAIITILKDVDADVVALQEVHEGNERDRSFLTALDRLNYDEVIYGPTMRNPQGRFGNVLMTKGPVRIVERINLSQGTLEPRGAIRVVVDCNGLTVDIIATHLGLESGERVSQLNHLISKHNEEENNGADLKIWMGDLNIWNPFSRENRLLRERFGRIRHPRTFPAAIPVLRLDRIHILPNTISYRLEAVQSGLARTSSDHLPLLAEIERGLKN